MKRLLFLVVFGCLFTLLTQSASAQTGSKFVQCPEPGTGKIVWCISQARSDSNPRTYSPEQSGTARTIPNDEQPVYQTQRSKRSSLDWDVGISPYSLRPYGSISRSTETHTVTVTTNNPNYEPNVRLDVGGRSYLYSRRRIYY